MARPDDRRRPQGNDRLRVNHKIRVPEIRLIDENGDQMGIVRTDEALRLAEERGVDLVEISPRSIPPVCRLLDYGKFKFEQSKKKQKAKTSQLKEMKFRPKTEEHDFDFKVKHIREFLEAGDKVKLVVAFRGREIVHPRVGEAMLKRVEEAVADIAVVETRAGMEGRQMIMILAPRPGRSATSPSTRAEA